MRSTFIAPLVAASVLSACGGGGSSVSKSSSAVSFPAPGAGAISVSELESYASVLSEVEGEPEFRVPNVAFATYTGYSAVVRDPNNSDGVVYMGRMTLDADFNAGTVSGNTTEYSRVDATNANAVFGPVLPGSVAITNGVITDDTFTSDFNGSISEGGTTLTVTSTIDGGFSSQSGLDAVYGAATGTISDGSTSNEMDGVVVGLR